MPIVRAVTLAIVVAAVASAATYLIATRRPAPAAAAPVGSIREIMQHIVDPSADGIFESVATVSGPNGVVDKAPSTDEDWAQVESYAWTLTEAATLLNVPGRLVAKPGDVDKPGDPSAPELTAAQVQEKIEADRVKWATYVAGLQGAALKALNAAQTHNTEALFAVGDTIDEACESCHLQYWYPANSKPKPAVPVPASRR
jgi:hypothetical protein